MEVFDLFAAQGMIDGADLESEGVTRHSLVEALALVEVDEVAFEKERMREFVELLRESFVTRFEGPHEGEVLPRAGQLARFGKGQGRIEGAGELVELDFEPYDLTAFGRDLREGFLVEDAEGADLLRSDVDVDGVVRLLPWGNVFFRRGESEG